MDEGKSDGTPLLSVTADRAFGAWNNILVVIWRKETTPLGVETLGEYLQQLGAQYPQGIGLCAVVEESAPPPSTAARKAMAKIMGTADMLRGSVLIFDGTGFRAAIVRSFVAGLNMLTRFPFPHKVCASAQEAIPWLAEQVPGIDGAATDARALLEAIGAIRQAYTE